MIYCINEDKDRQRGFKDTLATFKEMQMGDIVFSWEGEAENWQKKLNKQTTNEKEVYLALSVLEYVTQCKFNQNPPTGGQDRERTRERIEFLRDML